MQIILFGAPGVGKGTQAKILAKKYNIQHISTGDILRDSIRNETEFGIMAKNLMNKGELVPDELIGRLVKEFLKSTDYKQGFILDGFPRTIEQCTLLDDIFDELKIENPHFIILESDTDIIVNRLTARRQCTNCNTIISLKHVKDASTCPSCCMEGTFIKREDDDEDVVRKRLDIYRKTTFPVIDYYREKYNFIFLNAAEPVETVTQNIIDRLI
ncbi:MAG: adenylate kinase [Melioribacteraceae bacterium]|jgi:adenylate kinase|nr:adenylate kinase [Melioribacteraceae bacterium]